VSKKASLIITISIIVIASIITLLTIILIPKPHEIKKYDSSIFGLKV